jgi:hypothetical protein
MKLVKLALLGTAAVAAVSVSARADELSDLKAQIEALNARVAQVEAAPAVPAGYQLLSVSKGQAIVVPGLEETDKGYSDRATIISVMPTADVPASTEIAWSGYARAALRWRDTNVAGDDGDFDIPARGQLKVTGKTDTAVGQVGATIQLRGNYNSHGDASAIMNEAWGWWAVTPELTLGGGYTGSLSGIGYGYDGQCNCYYTDNASAGYGHGDTTQMRLSYASGPISAAIALEGEGSGSGEDVGFAAEVKFAGDQLSGEISGGWWSDDDAWAAIGVGFNMDMFSVGVSAGMGESGGVDFWKANILASVNMSDAVHAEVGYNHLDVDGGGEEDAILAGFYYDPVDKLTIGLEAEWIDGGAVESTQVDLVTVYRF